MARKLHDLITGTESSLISSGIYKIPNRLFIPKNVYQASCEGKNINFVGSLGQNIVTGSIALSEDDAIRGAVGEFFDRYCPTFSPKNKITGSYNELIKGASLMPPEIFKPYADWQYTNNAHHIEKFTSDSVIDWVISTNKVTGKEMYVPAFMIYQPHFEKDLSTRILGTSTGIASHSTLEKAEISGFLECAERKAFATWWYLQKEQNAPFYAPDDVLKEYNDKDLVTLLSNDKVFFRMYDLGEYSPVESIVTMMLFKYKGQLYQSIGASARFDKLEAFKKSILECYQGIDYAILLQEKKNIDISRKFDFSQVNDFDKHFTFYNFFPEFREKSPVLKRLQIMDDKTDSLVHYSGKMKSLEKEEIKKSELQYLFSVDITTADVEQLNCKVVRVLTPEWPLLTGIHTMPYLGYDEFVNRNLFTEFPHPFP